MKLKAAIKAGTVLCPAINCANHNQTLSQSNKPKSMKLKTALKAGKPGPGDCGSYGCGQNHNQTLSPRRV